MAGSVVAASATLGYGYSGRTVVLPVVPPLVSVQEPVSGPLSAAQSRLHHWVPKHFKSPQNLP